MNGPEQTGWEPAESPQAVDPYPGRAEFDEAEWTPDAPIEPEPQKAGFFRRAAAYLVDLSFLDLLTVFFMFLDNWATDLATGGGMLLVPADGSGELRSVMPLWTALFVLYFTFFTYWGGQTPGKMLLRLRVIPLHDEEISLPRAMIRTFGYFLSYATFFIGFLMAGITPAKRALHDYLAGTRVIRT